MSCRVYYRVQDEVCAVDMIIKLSSCRLERLKFLLLYLVSNITVPSAKVPNPCRGEVAYVRVAKRADALARHA